MQISTGIGMKQRGGLTPTQRAIALIRGQFSAGQAGLWWESSPFSSLFQDSVGITPVTAAEQPVGLLLDKRLGLVLGPEMLTNTGGPFTATTGWTAANATQSIVGGQIEVIATGVISQRTSYTLSNVVVGKWYEVSATFSSAAGNAIAKSARLSVANPGVSTVAQYEVSANGTPRTITFNFIATVTTLAVALEVASDAAWGAVGDKAYLSTVSCKLLDGNHALQATAGARPLLKDTGGFYSLLFDGTDDGLSTATFAAGTLTSNMDCFIAVKRNSSVKGILADVDATHFFGAFDSAGGAATASTLVGASSTYLVDGVAVPGGTGTTQVQLNTALTVGFWHVLEVRNLDLSAWTAFQISLLTGYFVNGNVSGAIVLPAQSDANRAVICKYLGAKVGLSL